MKFNKTLNYTQSAQWIIYLFTLKLTVFDSLNISNAATHLSY